MSMELLGEILHFSKSGRMIIKCENNNIKIRSGWVVMDEKHKKVGKVSELIGPVSSPYISLIPFIQKREKLKGQKVYGLPSLSKGNNKKSKIKRNKR